MLKQWCKNYCENYLTLSCAGLRCSTNMYWLQIDPPLCNEWIWVKLNFGLNIHYKYLCCQGYFECECPSTVFKHSLWFVILCLFIFIFDAMSPHRNFPQRVGHSRSVFSFSVFGIPFSTHCSSPTIFYCLKTCPLISLVIFPWFPLPFYIYCLCKVVTLLGQSFSDYCASHIQPLHIHSTVSLLLSLYRYIISLLSLSNLDTWHTSYSSIPVHISMTALLHPMPISMIHMQDW